MGLYLTGSHPLDRFGGGGETGLTDNLAIARNLVSYVSFCSASMVVLPERLSERPGRRALKGQAEENSTGPDQLDVVLRLLHRQGNSAWLELNLEGQGCLPGLPPPDSADALRQGLVRVDRQGLADGPSYHPLHPAVREALKRRVEQALAPRQGGTTFSGIMLQLGPGPTLLGNPDTGLDDDTFARFVHDMFGPETAGEIPGLATADPNRFATRSKYLSGVGRMPWLMWRSRAIAALYSELDEAARAARPARCWHFRHRFCMAAPREPKHDASIWPGWPPARPGGAWGWISRPGPRARMCRSCSGELSSRPILWRTTWPPALTWTPRS